MYETLYANFDERYRPLIAATLFEVTYDLSRKLLEAGSADEGRHYCRRCLSRPPWTAHLGSKAIVAMQSYAPWLFRFLIAIKRRTLSDRTPAAQQNSRDTLPAGRSGDTRSG